MVIHRSKFKKNLGHFLRGRITSTSDYKFQVKISGREGEEKYKTFKNERNGSYQRPFMHSEVMLRFHDLKSKEGKYDDSEKNMPFEILTLRGESIYRKK